MKHEIFKTTSESKFSNNEIIYKKNGQKIKKMTKSPKTTEKMTKNR